MRNPTDHCMTPESVMGIFATWKNFFCDRADQNFSNFTFLKQTNKQMKTNPNPMKQATQNILNQHKATWKQRIFHHINFVIPHGHSLVF